MLVLAGNFLHFFKFLRTPKMGTPLDTQNSVESLTIQTKNKKNKKNTIIISRTQRASPPLWMLLYLRHEPFYQIVKQGQL